METNVNINDESLSSEGEPFVYVRTADGTFRKRYKRRHDIRKFPILRRKPNSLLAKIIGRLFKFNDVVQDVDGDIVIPGNIAESNGVIITAAATYLATLPLDIAQRIVHNAASSPDALKKDWHVCLGRTDRPIGLYGPLSVSRGLDRVSVEQAFTGFTFTQLGSLTMPIGVSQYAAAMTGVYGTDASTANKLVKEGVITDDNTSWTTSVADWMKNTFTGTGSVNRNLDLAYELIRFGKVCEEEATRRKILRVTIPSSTSSVSPQGDILVKEDDLANHLSGYQALMNTSNVYRPEDTRGALDPVLGTALSETGGWLGDVLKTVGGKLVSGIKKIGSKLFSDDAPPPETKVSMSSTGVADPKAILNNAAKLAKANAPAEDRIKRIESDLATLMAMEVQNAKSMGRILGVNHNLTPTGEVLFDPDANL